MHKRQKNRSKELVVKDHPKSVVSESYRLLRTNLSFLSPDRVLKTLLFTSGKPDEGKSITVANLGISIAQTGKKILIIDADLRKPLQHRFFQMTNFEGLTNVLTGEADFTSVVKSTEIENLKLLNAGVVPPNPAELLGSQKMGQLLEEVKELFDMVLIDVPPVIAVTDGLILATKVDGVILVVAYNETNREIISQGHENLKKVQARVLGTVLTKYPLKPGNKYYYYYYGH